MVTKSKFVISNHPIKRGRSKIEYEVGNYHPCPTCHSSNAKIVWINKEKNAIAIQCPRSRHEHKKNAVILLDLNK